MTELERIKELTPKFTLDVLSNINRSETMITEMISVDFCKDASDIYKRVNFFNYFSDRVTLQPKLDLLKIILENNHPDVLKQYPDYFTEIDQIKQIRNKVAHNTIAYERDAETGENASLILANPRNKREKKLREQDMLDIIKIAEKISKNTKEIWVLIGKSKGIRFS